VQGEQGCIVFDGDDGSVAGYLAGHGGCTVVCAEEDNGYCAREEGKSCYVLSMVGRKENNCVAGMAGVI